MLNVFDYFTIHYLEDKSKKTVVLSCFALIVCIGLCDYWVGTDIGLSIFYLMPIFLLATWYAGISGGATASGISALIWFGAKRPEAVVNIILDGARSGLAGDGIISIASLDYAVKIRTKQRLV